MPNCLNTVALYVKAILELPMTSLVEKFKCSGQPMTLPQSKDQEHCSNGENKEEVETTVTGSRCTRALQQRDIIGTVQWRVEE